ncbi:ion transport protein [Methanobrevibacter ruminantium M1]|uniref:Ion transport protein n=1 Tax=Methanobrevibacter ruminantium (strain ATCC 35063 / DSM 1093 / JCM 13430 / OCM 146 / M1) TaxID=634498 RepID=D3E298_METRM|nr:ion transport protein [Methanobrevibacter ruminantium M1]
MKILKTWIEKLDIILSILIVLDISFLTASFLLDLNTTYINFMLLFDTTLCWILIVSFIFKLLNSDDRKAYMRENYLDFLASIPMDLVLLPFSSLHISLINIVILVRFLRLLLLFKESYKYVKKFFKATSFDKVVALFIVIVVGSTFALEYFDPAIPNLYYSLWFVFQTITTVGFGDVIPESPVGQLIALGLLMVGVLMFSIFTASFAYLFNEKVFREENEDFHEKINTVRENLAENKERVEEIRQSTLSTSEEIAEVKEKLNKSEENIKNLEERIDYLIDMIEKKE